MTIKVKNMRLWQAAAETTMTTKEPDTRQPSPPPAEQPSGRGESIDADALFRGRKEIVITHRRDRYILRITRSGKLILNK